MSKDETLPFKPATPITFQPGTYSTNPTRFDTTQGSKLSGATPTLAYKSSDPIRNK